jgi:pimeloyl-ACP methyl ester carboxylesterase
MHFTRKIISAEDLYVSYIEHGEGVPVVFAHGNWATCSWWEPVLMRLPDTFWGIAYDLRGRGRTKGPDSEYSIPSLAADLRAFTRALKLDSFHLVGHSLGSAVVMQFALDHPGQVRSLTVVAPAWVQGMPEDLAVAANPRELKEDAATFVKQMRAIAPTAPDDDLWKQLLVEGHEQRLEAGFAVISALEDWRPGNRLRSIHCPRLVLGGWDDIVVKPPFVKLAANALGTRAVLLPGVGHSPIIEKPALFVKKLRKVLAKEGGASEERPAAQRKEGPRAGGPFGDDTAAPAERAGAV